MNRSDRPTADVASAAAAGLADYADNMRVMSNERAGRLLNCILDYIDESVAAERAARADGFREGQERMRLSAAEHAAAHARCCTGLALIDAIRALPLEVDDA